MASLPERGDITENALTSFDIAVLKVCPSVRAAAVARTDFDGRIDLHRVAAASAAQRYFKGNLASLCAT